MPSKTETTTVLLCGVGGQGTILAADLLASTLLAAGYEVKLSEIHGMAQRGGAVTTVVRYGSHVNSMVVDLGSASHIVAFETTEALRNHPFLALGGSLLVNDESIQPLPVLTGKAAMPQHAKKRLEGYGAILIPAGELAQKAGSVKAANVVLLGALATHLDIPFEIWEEQIKERVPEKTIDTNLAAFHSGVTYVQGVA